MLKLTKVEDQKVYLENKNLKVKIVYIKKNSREKTERKPSSKKIPPPQKKKYIYILKSNASNLSPNLITSTKSLRKRKNQK